MIALVLSLAGVGSIQAQQPPAQSNVTNADRVANWKEDLHFFAATLRGTPIPGEKNLPGQKDLAKLYPHLDADLAALEADLPNLRNGVIYWRLARILASAHVAHNSIFPTAPQTLPVVVQWLDEGPVVTAASAEFKAAIGARLLKVGDSSPAVFLDSVSPYLSYETEGWRRILAGVAMRGRVLLDLLNFVQDDKVSLTIEGLNGPMVLAVPFTPAATPLMTLRENLGLPVSLADSHPEERYYWRQLLPESQTLYVQYRQCADDPKLKVGGFAAQTLAEIDTTQPRRVIIDLRFNQGGHSALLKPLTEGLAARRKIIGVPLVLIGPDTFSSGVLAARDLREKAKARLLGTPTGGLQGGYGEAPSRKLPHFPLGMQWTISNFPLPREPVSPDIKVVTTAGDLRAGRDPVLDAAIAVPR
ncbi:MAG: hypothetical protein ACRD4E_06490 [Bryobacteraceae bacterium]